MSIREFCVVLSLAFILGCPSDDEGLDPIADGSEDPASDPSVDPTADPTADPEADPTADPTADPVVDPAADPTADPSADPTADPTADPDAECPEGFEPSPEGCVDIDDCAAIPCSADATCENTEGSFTCTCNEGFEGNGFVCTPVADACGSEPEPFRFTKRNGSPGEDCITENVCITRGNNGPVYNSAREAEPDRNGCETISPAGVQFAMGACAGNAGPFVTLRNARACESMGTISEESLCMHLVEDDLWYDVRWHSFTGGGEGGGFSYTRTLAGGDPCGVGATCTAEGESVTCACPEGTEGDPESFCR